MNGASSTEPLINSATTSAPAPESSVVAQRIENASLLRRLEFKQLLIEVSAHFINLSAEEIDRHINQALGQVGSFLGFNLGAISKFSGQGRGCEVTHIWTAAGLPPIPPGFTELDFPWASATVAQGHKVHLTSLDVLPLEAQRDRQTYERFGLRSVYNWPLQVGGTVVGILSFASVGKAHGFPTDFEQGLKLLAQVMASSLARARDDRALRASEAKLSLAADAAGAGLWELNLATRSFWVTKKTRELFDFNSEEVVSFDRFLSLVHPEDRELVRRKLQQVLESKGEVQVEYRVLQPDGRVQWMYSRGRVHCDGSGQPVYLMGVTVDATPRKEAEEALRESEGRFRRVVEHIQDAVIVDDVSGRVVFANERFLELFGVRREDLATLTLEDYVAPEFRAELRERHERRIRGEKEPASFEYLGMRRDGRKMWLEVAVVPVTDEDGRVSGTQSAIRDIDARKRAEEALRVSEARLASAVEVAGLGFYDMGGDPGRIFVDERLRSLLGLKPQDSHRVQEFWIEHIHPDDRERVQELSRKVLGGQLPGVTVEYRYQHLERGLRWFNHVSRAQEQDATGKVVRRLGVIRDITEQKRAEEALHNFSARLIRTQEEERARLARELHDDITQRLARLAIDVGRAEAVIPAQPTDETGRSVCEELIRLSEDVHALSYRLHPSIIEDLGLPAALKAEAERFEQQGGSAIDVNLQTVPESVPAQVALCLFRVAQEALRNAGRHSGARTMKLSLRSLEGGLQLGVQDDGCGFDPAIQREHPSLGLSSMRERVRLLNGELEIESALGEGTTVLAWVPLSTSENRGI